MSQSRAIGHRHSLRRRLLVGMILIMTLGGLINGMLNYWESSEQVEELFDAEMAQLARTLQSLFSGMPLLHSQLDGGFGTPSTPLIYQDFALPGSDTSGRVSLPPGHRYEKKLAFQIWAESGALLLQSQAASDSDLSLQPAGYSDIATARGSWRVFSVEDQLSGYWIQVAQREEVRDELVFRITRQTLIIPLVMIPVLAILLWALITLGLRPLREISALVARREAFDSTPIELRRTPDEVQPLVAALNRLFGRTKEQAMREKQFSADAAHELRTPLAAAKLNLQNAIRRSSDERIVQPLARSLTALDRMIAMIEQLLDLSRLDAELDRERAEKTCHEVDLNAVVQAVVNELEPLARERNIRFQVSGELEAVVIAATREQAYSIVLNLISNSVKYADNDTAISIELDHACVTITDCGCGIPGAELAHVFERFYRVGGDQASGSGLGLAIVERIARRCGARITLVNRTAEQSGLIAAVDFRAS